MCFSLAFSQEGIWVVAAVVVEDVIGNSVGFEEGLIVAAGFVVSSTAMFIWVVLGKVLLLEADDILEFTVVVSPSVVVSMISSVVSLLDGSCVGFAVVVSSLE